MYNCSGYVVHLCNIGQFFELYSASDWANNIKRHFPNLSICMLIKTRLLGQQFHQRFQMESVPSVSQTSLQFEPQCNTLPIIRRKNPANSPRHSSLPKFFLPTTTIP